MIVKNKATYHLLPKHWIFVECQGIGMFEIGFDKNTIVFERLDAMLMG